MIFKPYECDFGIKYNSVNYDFEHVEGLSIEDPVTTKLVRGSNAANSVGLVYQEGTKEPKVCSLTLLGVSLEIHDLLMGIFNDKARCEFYVINRLDGSSKVGKNAILSQMPQQLSIDGNPESMNVVLRFETFDLTEAHKS
jgi:hypothetical protein